MLKEVLLLTVRLTLYCQFLGFGIIDKNEIFTRIFFLYIDRNYIFEKNERKKFVLIRLWNFS